LQIVHHKGFTQRGEPPPGKRWFIKDSKANFTSGIPYFADYAQELLEKLAAFVVADGSAKIEDKWGAIAIIDAPGAGKTTTVAHVLQNLTPRPGVFRVKADQGCMQALLGRLNALIKQLDEEMAAEDLLNQMLPSCFAALFRMIELYFQKRELAKDNDVGTIATDTIPERDVKPNEIATLLSSVLDTFTNGAPLVLVLDEMQCWAVPAIFERKRGHESVKKKNYPDYFMIAFTKAIAALVEEQGRFKVILVGTDLIIGHTIRIASELKCHVLTIPEMPPAVTKAICERYLDLDALGEQAVNELVHSVSYNPRALQFFLLEVSAAHRKHTLSDEIKETDIQHCINKAYKDWSTRISGYISNTILKDHADTFFITCLFSFPSAFGASKVEGGLKVPLSNAGTLVEALQNAGAIKASREEDGIVVLKPKGFLARYLFQRSPEFHTQDLALMFGWMMATATNHMGPKGHLVEKAIAAELTVPTSALYKQLFALLPNYTQLCPESQVAMHPVLQSTIDLSSLPDDHVVCVDDKAADKDRIVDVYAPLANRFKLCCSVKYDQNPSRVAKDFRTVCEKLSSEASTYLVCISIYGVTKQFTKEFQQKQKDKWKNCALVTSADIFKGCCLPIYEIATQLPEIESRITKALPHMVGMNFLEALKCFPTIIREEQPLKAEITQWQTTAIAREDSFQFLSGSDEHGVKRKHPEPMETKKEEEEEEESEVPVPPAKQEKAE